MLKAQAQLDDGSYLVVLGLSEGNVAALREDRPIVFDMEELKMPKRKVVLSYIRTDGKIGIPSMSDVGIGLGLNDAVLAMMKTKPAMFTSHGIKFFIFVGKDEASMQYLMREFIGPNTTVDSRGIPPSDRLPSLN